MFAKLSAIFAVVAVSASVPAMAATYTVDTTHSTLGFTVRHMMAKVNGQFNEFGGEITYDPAKPEATTGKVTAKTASIHTNVTKRDDHLRSPDFFDAAKNPELSFTITKVTADKKNKGKFKLEGDLSMHGVTRKETFDAEFLGTGKDPWGGTRAGFSATTKISRKDYGLTWNKALETGGVLVSDEVQLDINIEGTEKK